MNKYIVYSDCKYFPLDRPCIYQKNENAVCSSCKNYKQIKQTSENLTKILIIKLGAMGDVLRTTFVLEGLNQKFKNVSKLMSRVHTQLGSRRKKSKKRDVKHHFSSFYCVRSWKSFCTSEVVGTSSMCTSHLENIHHPRPSFPSSR